MKVALYSLLASILHCYIVLRSFCLQHTNTHAAKKFAVSAANEFVFITESWRSLQSSPLFFWRVCVHGLHEFYWKMCIFFGHALIWHDITKRRQPATMATITIKHERQRDNENSPATKYIYNVLMPVWLFRVSGEMVSINSKSKRKWWHGKGIDESQFYLTVLLIFQFQCNMLANVKCVVSENVDICQEKWTKTKTEKNSLESDMWNW